MSYLVTHFTIQNAVLIRVSYPVQHPFLRPAVQLRIRPLRLCLPHCATAIFMRSVIVSCGASALGGRVYLEGLTYVGDYIAVTLSDACSNTFFS